MRDKLKTETVEEFIYNVLVSTVEILMKGVTLKAEQIALIRFSAWLERRLDDLWEKKHD